MVWQLIPRIYIPKDWIIFEPACGKKDIVKALRKSNVKNKIIAKDYKSTGDDFLVCTDRYDMVFTNPPFSLATEFLETAFRVAKHMIIFLLPLDYLHGKDRFDRLWSKEAGWRISEIFVFVRRPMFTDRVRKDGKYSTGSVTFAWFVFIRGEMAIPPVMRLIDNSEYVVGVRKKSAEPEGQLMLLEGM
jgi:hypothetical protein